MSMNQEQAATKIITALEAASGLKVSEGGSAWVSEWCHGAGRGGEARLDIFASDEDDVEISGLLARIAIRGDAIVKLCEEKGVKEITPEVLVEVEKEMSTSGTRLCDPLLAQAAAAIAPAS